tara:strand:+ start:168 stop:428 length:261 start_codon:yes stop_codon:yes gene_type:complete
MKTVIHVNQHSIRRNQKNATFDPVLTVKDYQKNRYCHEAIILDDDGNELAKVVYSPENPLSCGARCWIETQNKVEVVRKKSGNNKE